MRKETPQSEGKEKTERNIIMMNRNLFTKDGFKKRELMI